MKQAVVLVMTLVACGGKAKDDGLIKAPILDEQKAKGSAAEPVPDAAAEETPPVTGDVSATPLEHVSAADLELPPKPGKAERDRQVGIAWTSASEGVELAKQAKWAEASAKFRNSVARVPMPVYFFDLCVTLHQEGKFSEALTSCDAAGKNEPGAALQRKTDQLSARIKADAKQQGIQLTP